MGWLEDKVIVVTGGGSGMGAAVARRCVKEGASVAVFDIMEHKVKAMGEALGDSSLAFRGDVTKVADQQALRGAVIERFGRVDAVIGTQGIWDGNTPTSGLPLDSLSDAFHEVFDVNVLGYLLSAKIFVEDLKKTRGSIVLTLSNAAFLPDGGGPLYTASKHACLGLVRQLAFEFAPEVRVNGLAPTGIRGSDLRGPVSLGMHDQSQADIPPAEFEAAVKSLVPLRSFASAEDYTSLYVVLASEEHSGVMTGQVILADQGLYVRPIMSA